jgi:hypothetical protein
MLDVVLYGFDGCGLLILQERSFPNLRELASFFASPDGFDWEWAEVEDAAIADSRQIVHYSADALRSMIMSSCREPSFN